MSGMASEAKGRGFDPRQPHQFSTPYSVHAAFGVHLNQVTSSPSRWSHSLANLTPAAIGGDFSILDQLGVNHLVAPWWLAQPKSVRAEYRVRLGRRRVKRASATVSFRCSYCYEKENFDLGFTQYF